MSNETDQQSVSATMTAQAAAQQAMACFEEAQRLYGNLANSIPPNQVLDQTIEVNGLELVCHLVADDRGVVTLSAKLPNAEGTTFDIRNGTLLVYQEDFGPPMYGYRLQVVNGAPRWLMIHRWRREGFINPNYPPAYADHLIEMLGQLFDHTVQEQSVAPQELLQGTGWCQQVLEGRELSTLAGLPATQELTQAYMDLSHGLWTFSQAAPENLKTDTPEGEAAARAVWKQMWDESLVTIRAALPSLH